MNDPRGILQDKHASQVWPRNRYAHIQGVDVSEGGYSEEIPHAHCERQVSQTSKKYGANDTLKRGTA